MMKRSTLYLLSLLVASLFGVTVMAQELQQDDSKKAAIEFAESEHDFGTISEGDGPVSFVFTFKNVGNAPLVLTRVISSCGCTTPSFSKDPIAPGKEGKVTVTYDPAGRVYPFVKTISVYSNGKKGPAVLTIRGEVIK